MITMQWRAGVDGPTDIPDLVRHGEHSCRAMLDGYTCTRTKLHSGRHAAGTGLRIVAVWYAW